MNGFDIQKKGIFRMSYYTEQTIRERKQASRAPVRHGGELKGSSVVKGLYAGVNNSLLELIYGI